MKGTLFVISAPSGTGKTTILKELIGSMARISFSISHTTRAPRTGEENGRDYFFVSKETFLSAQRDGAFLEHAAVHGNYYGTSKAAVLDQLAEGNDIILDIDVQGAQQLRTQNLDAVFIFIVPPSWKELERRLIGRGTDDQETIDLRLTNARQEMRDCHLYDYIIINDLVENAVTMLRAIIIEKRCKGQRTADGQRMILPEFDA